MRAALAMVVSVFILLVDCAALAQRPGSNLSGIVRITTNLGPAMMIRIQLQKSGMTVQETFPHENRFEFPNVDAGHYTLIAGGPGYVTVRQEVDVPGEVPFIEIHPQRSVVPRAESASVWDLRIPESARRQFEAARRKLLANNCTDALGHLRRAIHAYADYGDAHKAMGECYAQLNQLEPAEREFKKALEQPHAPELHLLLRKVYEREGNHALQAHQFELYTEETTAKQSH